MFRPAVEAGAAALRGLEDVGDAAIAAREDPFEVGEPTVVPAKLDAAAAELCAEERLANPGFLEGELPSPLERSVRLGREGRSGVSWKRKGACEG